MPHRSPFGRLELHGGRDAFRHPPHTRGPVDRRELAVSEQKNAVGDVSHTRQLVRGDDERSMMAMPCTEGAQRELSLAGVVAVVAQQELWRSVVGGTREEPSSGDVGRVERLLDHAGVRAAKTGQAVQERGRPGPARAEHCEALTALHFDGGAAQHPHASGASRHAGGVALPEGAGTKDDRHAAR